MAEETFGSHSSHGYDDLRAMFAERFGSANDLQGVRAPYRICPLGAHIDHQGGTVLGMSIDRGVSFFWRPRADGQVRLASRDFTGDVSFSIHDVPAPRGGSYWGDFAAGAVWALRKAGCTVSVGLEGVVSGELPVGGLSSSAAVGLAYGIAFRRANDIPLRDWEVIETAVKGENGYVGVSCGLLDPTTIFFGEVDSLVRIRCRDKNVAIVPPGRALAPYAVGVVFSGVERALARSGYNDRVSECRRAAELLGQAAGRSSPARLLCDITRKQYDECASGLPAALRRRAEHFFGENARVFRGLRAWQEGDLGRFGTLMNESGLSSVENYEAGCREVRALWELLTETPGVYGTRFSGGGFGGAVIALVDPAATGSVEEEVRRRYLEQFPACASRCNVVFRSSGGGLRWGPVV